jgi:hypothetical protein
MSELVPGYRGEWINPVIHDPERPVELPEGAWEGRISTPEGEVPLGLRVLAGSRVELRVGGGRAAGPAVASKAWDLRAGFELQLPTADAHISSPTLGVELRIEQERLTGVARAYKNGDSQGWLGNFLSHPCELAPC